MGRNAGGLPVNGFADGKNHDIYYIVTPKGPTFFRWTFLCNSKSLKIGYNITKTISVIATIHIKATGIA